MPTSRFRRVDARFPLAAVSALAVAAFALTPPSPSNATFHFAHIHRAMTGLDGNTDVQYVEIEMDQPGQGFVDGSKLIAFHDDGSFSHVVLVTEGNVTSGNGRPWIMASAAFEDASGIAPDFVFDSTGSNGLPAEDGMVCWGGPQVDETDPTDFDMVDCVSYGNFTGEPNIHTDAPSPVTPFGRGLVEVADTGSSADDFACEDPALPRNNNQETGEIVASTPCVASECGNGAIEEPETCDDGDADFLAGDFCSAECVAFACGVPTSSTRANPTTSDALFVLRAAVGGTNCHPRVCDVNNNTTVTSPDALQILRKAVGQDVVLACPVE